MQKLSTIFFVFAALFWGMRLNLMANPDSESTSSTLESGDKAFVAGQFTQAMKIYENLYDEGKFSEVMLYRLAFMYDNLRNYPQAIYYLKKAAQEFGEKDSDAKIRELMKRQGSTRFFTGDPWNAYLTFYRSWGWLIYLAFGLAIAGIAAHYLLPNPVRPIWRQLGMVSSWALLMLSGLMLFHRSFMVPQRAVLMQQTAFYDAPGFGANHRVNTFSLGETLDIDKKSDVWLSVSAGGKQCWVPYWVVRSL